MTNEPVVDGWGVLEHAVELETDAEKTSPAGGETC